MRKLIYIIMFVVCCSFVFAAPPFEEEGLFPDGLTIEFPQFEYLEIGEDYEVNLHVFNTSNGVTKLNDTTTCTYHLYNDSGFKIIPAINLSFNELSNDFSSTIKGGNFSYLGYYVILANCNAVGQGGFTNHLLELTTKGNEPSQVTNGSFLIVGLIFIFITSLLAVGLYNSKKIWIKATLTIGISILIMTLLRLSLFFVELSDPAHTGIFDVVTVFYMLAIWFFRFAMIAGIGVLLIMLLNTLTNYSKGKKSDWTKWGEDE